MGPFSLTIPHHFIHSLLQPCYKRGSVTREHSDTAVYFLRGISDSLSDRDEAQEENTVDHIPNRTTGSADAYRPSNHTDQIASSKASRYIPAGHQAHKQSTPRPRAYTILNTANFRGHKADFDRELTGLWIKACRSQKNSCYQKVCFRRLEI